MIRDILELKSFLQRNKPVARVDLAEVRGSAPRESGAWMLVGTDEIFRTIGGGQLELHAIDAARKALHSGKHKSEELRTVLGPETGQCCGGDVRLQIKVLDDQDLELLEETSALEQNALPSVYVFGAGHVGKALVKTLELLPVRPVAIDTRENELAGVADGIEKHLVAMPETVVRTARPGSAFVILTHDHSLDFLITSEALLRHDAVYVGMIGSKTKRAVFKNWIMREEMTADMIGRLTCPIGDRTVKDKRPQVIAALVAAEIMKCFAKRVKSRQTDREPEVPGHV